MTATIEPAVAPPPALDGDSRTQGWALTRDLTVSVVGGLFALWVTFAQGYQAVYQTMLLLLLGIPLYGFLKARRERLGLVAEPVEHVDELVPS